MIWSSLNQEDDENTRASLFPVSRAPTCNAHGEANIGLSQSRRIVGAISSDGDDVSALLEQLHECQFILWGGAGEHPQPGQQVLELQQTVLWEETEEFNTGKIGC